VFTLGDIAGKRARLGSSDEALVFGDVRLTYGELHERTSRLANALLTQGIHSGDRVAMLAENSHRYVEFFLAAAKAGIVATPLNFRLTERELLHMLGDSGARAVFVGAEFEAVGQALRTQLPDEVLWIGLDPNMRWVLGYEDLVRDGDAGDVMATVREDDLAVLMYTGGTTGLPKGVMLSHRNLLSAFMSMVIQFGFTARDVTLMVLPMFHVAIWQVICHLIVGARVVILRRPDVTDILCALESERCTSMNAVPTLYNWIVSDPGLSQHDLRSLRLLIYGGSPFPEEILRRCITHFGPVFAQGYGLTEAAPTVCFLAPQDHVLDGPRSRLLASAGREMPLTEVRIADEEGNSVPIGGVGEVLARGPNIMLGYWNNEPMTRERLKDGWLHTGDIGRMDEDGYVFLLDRKADMIVTGGENVYPSEIEGVLYTHPAVHECLVASAPDTRWGERVQAAVVLKAGMQASEDDLLRFCKENLAGYKCPKRIEFWDALPRSPVGKLLRKDVKKAFWSGQERQVR
jgi:long-chain acyl-CoA synthetase